MKINKTRKKLVKIMKMIKKVVKKLIIIIIQTRIKVFTNNSKKNRHKMRIMIIIKFKSNKNK